MLNNVLVLVHGPEVDHSTNRLYINKQIQLKGFATRDFVFENKLEGRHYTTEPFESNCSTYVYF